MKLKDVTYLTENAVPLYTKGINTCKTLFDLREFLAGWEGLADDAIKLAETFDDKTFTTFRKCLAMERKGKFSGNKNTQMVGTMLMPEMMFRATVLAEQFVCPWGTAVIRLATLTSQ